MSATYRLRQFLSAIVAHVSPIERALLIQMLTPGELLLFERMAPFDQRHCLDVYNTLVAAGYDDPILLRAALLHDCGKVDDDGRPIPLLYYGMFVIMQAVTPSLYDQAARSGRRVLRPFAVHATHERRAALLAEAVGSPPELVALLHDYSAQAATPRTQALRWADERS